MTVICVIFHHKGRFFGDSLKPAALPFKFLSIRYNIPAVKHTPVYASSEQAMYSGVADSRVANLSKARWFSPVPSGYSLICSC